MPTKEAKEAARARLARLDAQANKESLRRKKNVLRTKVAMGDKATRKKAATKLSSMPRQWKD